MEYRPKLDGLRCIAVMMVLIGHFLYFLGGTNPGIYGVNLFFVLSGFLITTILINEGENKIKVSYTRFLGRRALRIFPIYYLIIFFFISFNTGDIRADWPFLYSYTYNFHVSGLKNWEHNVYAPYWSLAVEEQFYIFFPFVILFLNRRPRWQLFALFLIVTIALLERVYGLTGVHHYVNLVPNMWALGIGALGAWFRQNSKLNRVFFNSAWIETVMLICLCVVFGSGEKLLGFFAYPLLNVYFVIKASTFSFCIKPVDALLCKKWSVFIGRISYGIYLYHIMVLHFFNFFLFDPIWNRIPFQNLGYFSKLQYSATLIKFPFVTVLTICVAYLSYRYIESPILRLKNKYFAIA
jgi:peptidoglycan/LPS O-acetylase OafA/YrhL